MKAARLAFCAMLFASVASAQISRRTAVPATLSGPLTILWEDNFATHAATARTMILDAVTRQTYEVHIDSAVVRSLGGVTHLRGMRARITATSDGRVTSIQPVAMAFPTTKPGVPMWTSRRVIVVLCRPSDGPTPFGSKTQFESLWFNGPMSVRSFWQESSYGQMDVTGDVLDWYTMPGKMADYLDPSGVLDLHKFMPVCEASIPQSVNLNNYDVVSYELGIALPVELGGYADTLTVRGVYKAFGTTISGYQPDPQNDLGAHAHELGHAISLFHTGPPDGNIYASDWDVMSGANDYLENGISFGAETIQGQKDLLGFIPLSRRFLAVGASNTITLERAALPSGNANYLMAVIPATFADSVADLYYTAELRMRAGFDRLLKLEGVVIHQRCFRCGGNSTFTVIDRDGNINPNDHGGVLQAGETFEDKALRISVTVESISGTSARVTIHNGSGRYLAVSSTGAKKTVVEGSAAANDSLSITTGGPTSTTWWTAVNQSGSGQWLNVLTPAGTGSGVIRFRRDASHLAPGTYYDTLRISGPAASSDPLYYDTLVVAAGSTAHLGLSVTARRDSNFAGIGGSDSTLVRIAGSGASTAAWTATRKKPWGFLDANGSQPSASGTGNGVVRWSRVSATTTPAGWYVDTITVKLTANPADSAVIFDSLLVVPPVQYTIPLRGHRDSIVAGGDSKLDSVSVSFAGLWATRAKWSLRIPNKPLVFLAPIENNIFANTYVNVGNGAAYYHWIVADSSKFITLRPGTYIDTMFVTGPFPRPNPRAGSQDEQMIIDTLVVVAPPATGPGLQLSPRSRLDTIALGMNASVDSVFVRPIGAGADTAQWDAVVFRAAEGQLTGPGGTLSQIKVFLANNTDYDYGSKGTGWLRYQRNVTGLAPGTYVNTINLASPDGKRTAALIDTMVILPGTALSIDRGGHADSLDAQSAAAVPDSVSLFVLGTNASSTAWTVTKRRSFTTLATTSGTGPATLRWTRNATGLAAGVYFDTITVSAGANARGTFIIDTIRVKSTQQSQSIAAAKFDADSVGGILNYEFATNLIVNTTPLNQSLGQYAALVTWDSTVVQLDSARAVNGGFAQPTVAQANRGRVSLSATDAGGKSGVVSLARLYFHFAASNVGKTTSIAPAFSLAKSASGSDLLQFLIPGSATATVIPGVLRGDVNADAKLTSADALLLVRALVGFPPPAGTTLSLTPNGDANCNGKAEAVDVQYILAKLVGLPVGTACVGTIK
jgi:hypothetical protein